MMSLLRSLAAQLTLLASIDAADPDPVFKWTSNGVKEHLTLPAAVVIKCPMAAPEKGELPTSFAQAESLATKAAGFSIVDLEELRLTSVRLDGQQRWFYLATFSQGELGSRNVAVLMDGTVIRAVIQQPAKGKMPKPD